jgi:hypothetical protein
MPCWLPLHRYKEISRTKKYSIGHLANAITTTTTSVLMLLMAWHRYGKFVIEIFIFAIWNDSNFLVGETIRHSV